MLALLMLLSCTSTSDDSTAPAEGSAEIACPMLGDIAAPIGSIPVVMECLDGYCWPVEWETSGGVLHVQCLTDDAVILVRWL